MYLDNTIVTLGKLLKNPVKIGSEVEMWESCTISQLTSREEILNNIRQENFKS